jgi:hypothetical protein
LILKKEGNTQNTHRYPSDLPGLYYIHSKTRTLCCFPDLLQLKDYCAEPHNATSDHTDGPFEPHVSQHKNDSACDLRLNIYNAPAQPDITDRHHSTSQINFLSFISQKTLRQHKLLDPCHHLICPTTLRSKARTCQLLIAAEEKTSNLTPKCSLSSCLSILSLYLFLFTPSVPLPTKNLHQLLLINRCWLPPKASSSSHSSPRSLPSIPHQ